MNAKETPATPGQAAEVSAYAQAAFDAFWSSPALGEEPPQPLDRESPGIRNAWERAVHAVLKDAFPGLRRQLDEARAALSRQPQPEAPGRPATSLEGALLANVDALNDLVRDIFEAYPDTSGISEWRDRAGALHVHDPDGKPYRALTEDDLFTNGGTS